MIGKRSASEWRYLVAGLIVVDGAGVALAMGLAYYLRFVWQIMPYSSPRVDDLYLRLILITIPVWLVLFWMHGLYNSRFLFGGFKEYALVANACTYGAVALIVVIFIQHQDSATSRGWLILVWALSILVVGLTRFVTRRLARRLRRQGFFVRNAIIAGADEQGVAIAGHLSPAYRTGVRIVGFVHDYLAPGSIVGDGLRVLGEPTELESIARQHDVDLVIVVPGALSWESLQEVMQLAADDTAAFECRLLPGLYDIVATGVEVDMRGPVPFLSLHQLRIKGIDRVLKGILDYGGCGLLLVISAPVVLLLTLLSLGKGKHLVEGREFLGVKGRPFQALAFNGWWNRDILKSGNAVERFLYRRRMYRLPGLLNVLKGEMSLVGPRRVTKEQLQRQPKWRHSILSVKPGLTGPWLLAGGEKVTLDKSLHADLHYVRNYTIWLDLQILFQTVVKLVSMGFDAKVVENEREQQALPSSPLRSNSR